MATFVAYGVRGAHAGAAVLVYRVLTLIGLVGIGWLSVALLAVEDRRRARSPHAPQLAMEPGRRARQRRGTDDASTGSACQRGLRVPAWRASVVG